MALRHKQKWYSRISLLLLILVVASATELQAQENKDLDAYTVRVDGFWFYSQPSGSFHGTGNQGLFDLQKDANFNSYSTGAGRIDWKFTRKNHLFLGALPLNQSKEVIFAREITFQGVTYGAGLTASARLQSYLFTPGYQYDIFRRRRGHLGIVAQLDLFYIKGSISAAAQTLNGTFHTAQASSATLHAPLPVAGLNFRFYLIPDSRRLFVTGNVLGMYFFGYGSFISSYGTLGVSVNRYLNFQGGYQLGSRLDIKSKSDRIGLNLTQVGALAGLEVSF